MYTMVCTKLDIAYVVGVVSRCMSNPGKQHQEVVKWILRYLWGITKKCLCFRRDELKLQEYMVIDFFGEIDRRRNTTRYVFTLSTATISWIFQLQNIVALSTNKVEYVAMIETSKEMTRLHSLLAELGFKQVMNVLHSDSQNTIHLLRIQYFIQGLNIYHFIITSSSLCLKMRC